MATNPHGTSRAWRDRNTAWRTLEGALIGFGVLSFAVFVWDVTVGGFFLTVLGVRISSWEAYKPFRNGAIATVVALWLRDWRAPHAATWHQLHRWSGVFALGVTSMTLGLALAYGSRSAGASDPFGYVSQARLWASGQLLWRDRFAGLIPTLGHAVPPLGYDVARIPGAMVPTYSPGFPMVMAAALGIGGDEAVYYVVPLLAAVSVWLTYTIGARLANRRAAAIAALLFAFSPIFLFQSFEPMSDVPATAWWLLAWRFALAPATLAALAAGLAAAAAVLTRPNLVVLGIVLLFVAARRHQLSRASLFICGFLPACLAIAALNDFYYGSPIRSGYGRLDTLYLWSNAGQNFRNYAGWLVDLHTPAILVALIAPLVTKVKRSAAVLAFAGMVALSYLFYAVFDNWTYLRFLLPAIPLLFVLAAAVLVAGLERLPASIRGASAFLVCLLMPCWYVLKADRLGVFNAHRDERRYVAVGEFLRHRLPANAAVITVLHSGSIRWYADRATIRWDWVRVGHLDEALAVLQSSGYEPYILLEQQEEAEFRTRFAEASVFGRVDWPPTIEYLGPPPVRVYAVRDRLRYIGRERILPTPIPPP